MKLKTKLLDSSFICEK